MEPMVQETAFRSEEEFTQKEFRRWLERRPASDVNHYELLRGRIVMSPPASWRHGRIGAVLVRLLETHVEAGRLGRVFDASTGFELPSGETLEPDVAFVSRERWEAGPRPQGDELLRIVPDLVVEILSPSTARRDRTEKREIYAQNGVGEYWLVDPLHREVGVLRREGGGFGAPVSVSAGPIPSLVLSGLAACAEDLFAGLE